MLSKLLGRKKAAVADDYSDLHQSYGRCNANGPFIERFYDVFLDSHPDVRRAFANTDFDRQRRLLRRTLTSAIMYAAGSGSVEREIAAMAEIHSRKGRAPVQPHLYGYWLDSLITVIREFDPECDFQLERRWREALNKIVDHFTGVY